jgi:hypothetical protein
MNIIYVCIPPSPTDDTGGYYYWKIGELICNALDAACIDAKTLNLPGSNIRLEFETNDLKCTLDVIIEVLKKEVEGERPGSTIRVIGEDVSRLTDWNYVGDYQISDGKWYLPS